MESTSTGFAVARAQIWTATAQLAEVWAQEVEPMSPKAAKVLRYTRDESMAGIGMMRDILALKFEELIEHSKSLPLLDAQANAKCDVAMDALHVIGAMLNLLEAWDQAEQDGSTLIDEGVYDNFDGAMQCWIRSRKAAGPASGKLPEWSGDRWQCLKQAADWIADDSAALPQTPDGPEPPNLIHWHEKTYTLPPQPWKLLNFMWDRDKAPIDEVVEELWGHDSGKDEPQVRPVVSKLGGKLYEIAPDLSSAMNLSVSRAEVVKNTG